MRRIIVFISTVVIFSTCLSAQKNELIIVKSGNRILDYFPFQERYRYPEFIAGRVFFRSGVFSSFKLNYNLLLGEMEFIQSRDTLVIANKKDVKYILVADDTFYYDKCYLERISRSGQIEIALNQYIKLKEVQKKDAYGISSSGSSSQSYGSLPADGNFYKLSANADMVFQKVRDYYLSTPTSGFIPFRKKTVMQLYPQHENEIKNYLKSNDIDFDSKEDLIRLTGFIAGLKD